MEEQNEHISASLTLESKVSLALLRPYGTKDKTLRQEVEGRTGIDDHSQHYKIKERLDF